MPDHPISSLLGLLAATTVAAVTAAATHFRVLPEVIDLSIIATAGGLGTFIGAAWGVLRGHDHDRTARASLGAALWLAGLAAIGLAAGLIIQLLS